MFKCSVFVFITADGSWRATRQCHQPDPEVPSGSNGCVSGTDQGVYTTCVCHGNIWNTDVEAIQQGMWCFTEEILFLGWPRNYIGEIGLPKILYIGMSSSES